MVQKLKYSEKGIGKGAAVKLRTLGSQSPVRFLFLLLFYFAHFHLYLRACIVSANIKALEKIEI